MKSDPFNLQRFVDAQDQCIADVEAELRSGFKVTHWMWFVFPQLAGLGSSQMAQRYAISSHAEAKAYLEHPILGPRLRHHAQLVLEHNVVFPYPDDLKLHSSMELFSQISEPGSIFSQVLTKAT